MWVRSLKPSESRIAGIVVVVVVTRPSWRALDAKCWAGGQLVELTVLYTAL